MNDENKIDYGYTVTDSALTTFELIKQYEAVAKLAKEMNVLIPYMLADIEFKKSRSELFEKISSHLTGLFLIGSITKLGAIVIGLIAPFIIQKIKIYIIGL